MPNDFVAAAIQEGSKLLGSLLRSAILKPSRESTLLEQDVTIKPPEQIKRVNPKPAQEIVIEKTPEPVELFHPETTSDADYRWECCCKHLGAAAVLLREAHERAVTNKVVDDSVSEKIMAALNEHAGMDDDIKAMLSNPEAREAAQRLMDGCRQLRRAAWDCKITTGGGTVDDVADARMWNDILYNLAYSEAKKHAGTECIRTGM